MDLLKNIITMKIIKDFNNLSHSDYITKVNNQFKTFLRLTENPIDDLKRGFSCHVDSWFEDYDEALEYNEEEGSDIAPKYDEKMDTWCGLPEKGLSGYKVENEEEFNNIKLVLINTYGASGDDIAVFKSKDYDLKEGFDGEDVFRNGYFLFSIDTTTSYEEYLKLLEKNKMIWQYSENVEMKHLKLFEQFSNKTLYHITTPDVAKEIGRKGFNPENFIDYNYYSDKGKDGIYFYDNLRQAQQYAYFLKHKIDDDNIALITIDAPIDIVEETEKIEDGLFIKKENLSKIVILDTQVVSPSDIY